MNETIAQSNLSPATPTVTPLFVEPHSHASITDAQGAQIERDIREDLAKGKISQAIADARFAELNTPLDQRVAPPDTRTAEQKLIDDHFPPAKESRLSDSILPSWTRAPLNAERSERI